MKKLAVVLAVVSLLGLVNVSQAADLQVGWFVDIYGVDVYSYDNTPNHLPYLRCGAQFLTTPGQYGPFAVSDGGYNTTTRRDISVPQDTFASPDQSLVLPVYFAVPWNEIAFLGVSWGTNYDASQMKLEFWREAPDGTQNRIWSQNLSGTQYDGTDLLQDGVQTGNYFFKVAVVPELSSITGFVLGIPLLIGFARRRK